MIASQSVRGMPGAGYAGGSAVKVVPKRRSIKLINQTAKAATDGHGDATGNASFMQAEAAELQHTNMLAEQNVMTNRSLIHPSAKWLFRWDLTLAMMIIFSVLVVPYRIGFDIEIPTLSPPDCLDIFIDISFCLDMAINFNTAFFDEREERMVEDRRRIALRYLKGWFVIDLLSTVPFDRIFALFGGGAGLRSLKLIRVLRLVRLLKLAKLFKLGKFATFMEDLNLNPAILRLLKMLCQIVFIAHLLCCFWYFLASYDKHGAGTWTERTARDPAHANLSTQYLVSFYWVIATMMAVGYGDIFGTSDAERMYTIVTQVVGAACFGFIIATVTQVVQTMNPRSSTYKAKMADIAAYMRECGLPKELRKKVERHFEFYLVNMSVFKGPRVFFGENQILDAMPQELRVHALAYVHRETIDKIAIFRNSPDACFVAEIVRRLHPFLAPTGYVVFKKGEVAEEMYFLLKGKVHMLVAEDDDGSFDAELQMMVRKGRRADGGVLSAAQPQNRPSPTTPSRKDKTSLSDGRRTSVAASTHDVICGIYVEGSHFGEYELLCPSVRRVTAKSSVFSELLTLGKEDLEKVLYLFPNSCEPLLEEMAKANDAFTVAKGSEELDESSAGESEAAPGTRRRQSIVFNGALQDALSVESMHFGRCSALEEVGAKAPGSGPKRVMSVREFSSVLQEAVRERIGSGPATEEQRSTIETMTRTELAHTNADVANLALPSRYCVLEEPRTAMLGRKVVDPDLPAKTKWDVWVGLLIMVSVLWVPFQLGFPVAQKSGFEIAVEWFIDICFFTDIFLSCRTAYHHPVDHDVIVTAPSMIVRNYCRGWFAIDFVSAFPFDLVVKAFLNSGGETATPADPGGGGDSSLRSLKLVRVARLFRLLKLARIFKLQNFWSAVRDHVELSPTVMRLCKLFAQLAFIAHLFGCMWHFVADGQEHSWVASLRKNNTYGASTSSHYIASVYWAFTTMTTVGYGDITPQNNTEMAYSVIIMILGGTVFGYIVGSIATLINSSEGHVETASRGLAVYIEEQQLPAFIRTGVKRHFEFFWQRSGSLLSSRGSFLDELPISLRREVLLCHHAEPISKMAIFSDCHDSAFIAHVLKRMQPAAFFAGQQIVSQGYSGRAIYFIIAGICEKTIAEEGAAKPPSRAASPRSRAHSPEGDGQEDADDVKEVLHARDFFGHEALLNGTVHQYGIRAFSACSMYVLDKEDIGEMVDSNPVVALKLQQAIESAITAQLADAARIGGHASQVEDKGDAESRSEADMASAWRLSSILALSPNSHRFDFQGLSEGVDTEDLRKRRSMRRLSLAGAREDRYTSLHSVNPAVQRINLAHPEGAIAKAMRHGNSQARAGKGVSFESRAAAEDMPPNLTVDDPIEHARRLALAKVAAEVDSDADATVEPTVEKIQPKPNATTTTTL